MARACRALCCSAALSLAGCAASHQPMGEPAGPPALAGGELVAGDGVRLPLRSWLPQAGTAPRAVLVALHGMNDYSNAFAMPAAYWARHGVATYAYDQRGFGASPRPGVWSDTATLAADIAAAVRAVGERHPGVPVYLLGESMGAAAAVAALAGRQPPEALAGRLDGVILSAPALWGRQAMNAFYRLTLWAAYHVLPGLEVEPPPGLKIRPSDNLPMLRGLAADPLVLKRTRIDALKGLVDLMSEAYDGLAQLPPRLPVLVLYGLHEEVLAPASVTRALARLDQAAQDVRARVAVYREGYHMLLRDRQAETVWDDVLAWLAEPGAPLPSGADAQAWQEPAAR